MSFITQKQKTYIAIGLYLGSPLTFIMCYLFNSFLITTYQDLNIDLFINIPNKTNVYRLNIPLYIFLASIISSFLFFIQFAIIKLLKQIKFSNYIIFKTRTASVTLNITSCFLVLPLVAGVEGNGFGFIFVPIFLILGIIDFGKYFFEIFYIKQSK